MTFRIEPEIFDTFPGMNIVTVIARDIDNQTLKQVIVDELHEAWQYAGQQARAYGNAQSHPNITPWGEHMKKVGVNRKNFPSSIEAMLRRARKGGPPMSINPLVDFYNAISLKYLVPAGGFDIDVLRHEMLLRYSRTGDRFRSFDAPEAILVEAGEFSYASESDILTRHFIWRQSDRGLIQPETKSVLLVSEILGELSIDLADIILHAFLEGMAVHFGVKATGKILNAKDYELEG